MKETWRWFGPDDTVKLAHVHQAGASGIVSALHHLNDGRAWPADEIARRKAEIEGAGLTWDVVESIIVHEDIKTRTGRYTEYIDNYKPICTPLCRMAATRFGSTSSTSAPTTCLC
jgi:mannonate dehydratase